MDFYHVDVFTDSAFAGNPLAVLPDASSLGSKQMQAIASELNLSETAFVTAIDRDSYSVRIFTPKEELPFAGHPTIGTAWLLSHLGLFDGSEIVQHSGAGPTPVRRRGDETWLERRGASEADIGDREPDIVHRLARALGIEDGDVELEAREIGRSGRLRPAVSNAGLDQIMVPVKSVEALGRCRPDRTIAEQYDAGLYCFTALQAGRLQARGFFPGVGVSEDPATGSAAAALGLYLADRVGDIDFEIRQGIEMGRPSVIRVRARRGVVEIGGRCALIAKGTFETLPVI
jgi:trans-2,3-dihydro-3-hydroxyanthranilate isomerase